MPKLYIAEFVGISNRLETLPLAFASTKTSTASSASAVPAWWYASTMSMIKRVQPDVVFFLSGTGDPASLEEMREFDFLTLGVKSHYRYKGDGHGSKVHPVADLFALACCPVIVATPLSGYSHWAANDLPLSDLTRVNLGRPADTSWL